MRYKYNFLLYIILRYPNDLAWYIPLSKSFIRKSPVVSKFHRFLVDESDQVRVFTVCLMLKFSVYTIYSDITSRLKLVWIWLYLTQNVYVLWFEGCQADWQMFQITGLFCFLLLSRNVTYCTCTVRTCSWYWVELSNNSQLICEYNILCIWMYVELGCTYNGIPQTS